MKKLAAIMFSLLILAGCGQSSETDESKEVSGNVETKEVQFTVDAKERQGNVQFEMTLKNNTDEEKNFEFRSGQKYDIIVQDKNGAEVYKYSRGRMFTQAIQYVNLLPGESQTWQETWDLKSDGEKVKPGEYNVIVVLTGKAEGVKTLQAKEKLTVSE